MSSKYQPLTDYLNERRGRELRMSFADIERIIGQPLPAKSKGIRAWWSNNPGNNVMTRAWLAAGFRTAKVNVDGEMLTFAPAEQMQGFSEVVQNSYQGPVPSKPATGAGELKARRHPAFGSLKGMTIVMPGVDLTAPADPQWAKVYDDDHDHGVILETHENKRD